MSTTTTSAPPPTPVSATRLEEVPAAMLRVWKRRVQEAVRVKQPEDADRIAENCAVAEWFGDYYPAVLHEAAKFYGTECHCYECTRRRELNRA